MDKIWVLTEGSYSDYHIVAVCGNEEYAQKLISVGYGDDIEEYIINPGIDKVNQGLLPFFVSMRRNGDTTYINRNNNLEMELDKLSITRQHIGSFLMGNVWAKNKEHAVKITNEKRAQLIANGEWEE